MSGEKGYTNQALELNENGTSSCKDSEHTGACINDVSTDTYSILRIIIINTPVHLQEHIIMIPYTDS